MPCGHFSPSTNKKIFARSKPQISYINSPTSQTNPFCVPRNISLLFFFISARPHNSKELSPHPNPSIVIELKWNRNWTECRAVLHASHKAFTARSLNEQLHNLAVGTPCHCQRRSQCATGEDANSPFHGFVASVALVNNLQMTIHSPSEQFVIFDYFIYREVKSFVPESLQAEGNVLILASLFLLEEKEANFDLMLQKLMELYILYSHYISYFLWKFLPIRKTD